LTAAFYNPDIDMKAFCHNLPTHLLGELYYEVNYTFLAVHSCLVTPHLPKVGALGEAPTVGALYH